VRRTVFAALLASFARAALAAGAAAPPLRPSPPPPPSHEGETRCAVCHTTEGWRGARFPHDKTGFPLAGQHARTSCKACHPISLREATGSECATCHRDPHGGISGRRCGSCHDAESWRATFDANAHRRTNFPLQGRHALIPCEECHGDRRDRAFSRPTVQCAVCHQADYDRTAGGGVDHAVLGFSTSCRDCHTWWRFAPAYLPAHEACFAIANGVHSGIRCLACHTTLAGASMNGQCNTGTASCTRCHDCGNHPAVPGFQCTNRKCYECHRFAAAGGALRLQRGAR
jgi:hypothetical protein